MGPFLQIHLTGNDKTRADACMHGQRLADSLFILWTDGRNDFVDLSGSLDCPYRIIFVGFGSSKKGHDGITDELFDETIVSENDFGNLPEDLSHDLFHFFRVKLL